MVIDSKKLRKVMIAAAVIAITVICLIILQGTIGKAIFPKKYSDFVEKYSDEYGVDEVLVYAIIKTESSFDSDAVSNVGAIGLMQIMPDTFQWLQFRSPENEELSAEALYDPETNIKYGVYFLSILQDEFNDQKLVIAAYHAGRGQVNSWLDDTSLSPDGKTLDDIPSDTTSHYVSKVSKNIEIYNKIYKEREISNE